MTGKRIKHTDQEWFGMLQDCMNSQMTIKDWCEQQEITIKAFYYHLNQLRRKGYEIPSRSAPVRPKKKQEAFFLDLPGAREKIPSSYGGGIYETAVRIDFHGVSVEISNDAAQETISYTLLALQGLC